LKTPNVSQVKFKVTFDKSVWDVSMRSNIDQECDHDTDDSSEMEQQDEFVLDNDIINDVLEDEMFTNSSQKENTNCNDVQRRDHINHQQHQFSQPSSKEF
jgi:hypothetical protein